MAGLDLRPPMAAFTAAFGVAITITTPDGTTNAGEGIWLSPNQADQPFGTEFGRGTPDRIMAIPRSVMSYVPNGSLVAAPEFGGGQVKRWIAERLDRSMDPEHLLVVLKPAPEGL